MATKLHKGSSLQKALAHNFAKQVPKSTIEIIRVSHNETYTIETYIYCICRKSIRMMSQFDTKKEILKK